MFVQDNNNLVDCGSNGSTIQKTGLGSQECYLYRPMYHVLVIRNCPRYCGRHLLFFHIDSSSRLQDLVIGFSQLLQSPNFLVSKALELYKETPNFHQNYGNLIVMFKRTTKNWQKQLGQKTLYKFSQYP